MIAEQTSVAENGALSEPAIVQAGDYINKLTGEQIEYECRRKIDEGYREIVVSFAETEIVNSIGISILLGIVDTAAQKGATVAFRDVNENTIELFEMLGLTKHVTIL